MPPVRIPRVHQHLRQDALGRRVAFDDGSRGRWYGHTWNELPPLPGTPAHPQGEEFKADYENEKRKRALMGMWK